MSTLVMQHTFISPRRILDDLEGNSSINPEIKKEPIRDQNDCMDNNNNNEIQVQSMLPPNALPQDMTMANQLNLLSSTSKYVFQNPAVSLIHNHIIFICFSPIILIIL